MNAHTNAHTRRHLLSESQQGSSPGSSGRITCGQSPLNAFGFSNKRRVNLYPGLVVEIEGVADQQFSGPSDAWPDQPPGSLQSTEFDSPVTPPKGGVPSAHQTLHSMRPVCLVAVSTSGFLHPRIRLKKKKRVKVIVSVWLLKSVRKKNTTKHQHLPYIHIGLNMKGLFSQNVFSSSSHCSDSFFSFSLGLYFRVSVFCHLSSFSFYFVGSQETLLLHKNSLPTSGSVNCTFGIS